MVHKVCTVLSMDFPDYTLPYWFSLEPDHKSDSALCYYRTRGCYLFRFWQLYKNNQLGAFMVIFFFGTGVFKKFCVNSQQVPNLSFQIYSRVRLSKSNLSLHHIPHIIVRKMPLLNYLFIMLSFIR